MVKLVEQSCEKLSVRCMKKWLVFHSFQKVYEEAGIEIDPKYEHVALTIETFPIFPRIL